MRLDPFEGQREGIHPDPHQTAQFKRFRSEVFFVLLIFFPAFHRMSVSKNIQKKPEARRSTRMELRAISCSIVSNQPGTRKSSQRLMTYFFSQPLSTNRLRRGDTSLFGESGTSVVPTGMSARREAGRQNYPPTDRPTGRPTARKAAGGQAGRQKERKEEDDNDDDDDRESLEPVATDI